MNNRLTSILLAIALIGSLFLYFNKPSGHDREMTKLQQENKELRTEIATKDKIIERSWHREQATRKRLEAVETIRIKDSISFTSQIKWFQNERKRKTGLLTDSLYTITINELYPR